MGGLEKASASWCQMKKNIYKDEVLNRRDELVDLCAKLVSSPSITPPGDTRAAMDIAKNWLETRGIICEVHYLSDQMPNLVAVIEGSKPGPRIVLNGHLDTMSPMDESQWSVPIFELTKNDGRLYGLGMGNMKGGVAALCMAAFLASTRKDLLYGSVVLTLVSDEVRFGPHGSAHLIKSLPKIHGDAVISAEGAGWMSLAIAEKGVAWIDLVASGPTGHASAAKTGETAVAKLSKAILELDKLNDLFVEPPATLSDSFKIKNDPGFRIAASTGIITAGDARGLIAPQAEAKIDIRIPPGFSLSNLDIEIEKLLTGTGVMASRVRGWEASWTSEDETIVKVISSAIENVRGETPVRTVRHPASDVMRWREIGVPGVCFGPQPTFSAGIDDYAEEEDVIDCAAVYLETIFRYSQKS